MCLAVTSTKFSLRLLQMRIGTLVIPNCKHSLMLPTKSIFVDRILTPYSDNYQNILAHLKQKLEVPAFEWRRVLKSLTAIEYLLKNGPPRFAQDLKMDMYKLMNLQSFSYYEDGLDRGLAIREKAILLQDLVQQPQRLEVERD